MAENKEKIETMEAELVRLRSLESDMEDQQDGMVDGALVTLQLLLLYCSPA